MPSISIAVYSPEIDMGPPVAYTPRGDFLFMLDGWDAYTHTIQAVGGYWQATVRLKVSLREAQRWAESGLNRHIEVYNQMGEICWEGFVNSVQIGVGGLSVTIGPMMDVANRVGVFYSAFDTTTQPPTVGARTQTTYAEDAESQAKYGVLEMWVEGGELDNSPAVLSADSMRDVYLAQHAWPMSTMQWSNEGLGDVQLTLDLLGYVHRLSYPYMQGVQNVTVALDTMVGYVLDGDPGDPASTGDPNNLFSSTNARIDANAVLYSRWQQDQRPAWDILQEIAAFGDGISERWLVGVYAGRVLYYYNSDTADIYQSYVFDSRRAILTMTGAQVLPENALPGRWLVFNDLMISGPGGMNMYADPRALFIESVTYSYPYGLRLAPGRGQALSDRVGQLGLGGMD